MCWNQYISINTFVFGVFVLLLVAFNNKYSNYKIEFFNNIYAYLLDVITTALSINAQILMIYRYKEQWILWIIIDILQIILYSINNIIINIVIMWFVFLCNAFYGLFIWYKK